MYIRKNFTEHNNIFNIKYIFILYIYAIVPYNINICVTFSR